MATTRKPGPGKKGQTSREGRARTRTKAALRESEERLRLALAGANQGLYDLNLQTGRAIVTAEYARMLGYEPDELDFTADWWREQMHPDDREMASRTMAECVRGERTEYRIEYRLRTKAGDWKWILSIGKVVKRDSKGRPLRMLGTHTDMTERVRAEEALERTRLLLQAVLDQSPVAMVVASAPDMVVRFGNKAAIEILGIADEPSYEGIGLLELQHRQSWRDLRLDGTPIDTLDMPLARAMRGQTTLGEEYIILRKDGTRRRELVIGAPVYDRNGELIAGVIAFPDLTALRQAEEAVKESRERLALALQGADLGSWDWDVQTGALSFNERWAQILGHRSDEIEPHVRSWESRVHPEDLPRVRGLLAAHLEGKTPSYESEHRLRHKSGSWVWILDKGKVISRDAAGTPLRAVGTHLDITDRKRAEEERNGLQEQLQQAMKMEAVGRLAGGIAHDFNNLLTAIIGNVDLARMSLGAPDSVARCLDGIGTAAESAASLTRQLLAFSRRQIIEPKALDLNELVGNLQKMLTRLIGEDVAFQAVLGEKLGSVRVDPGQFEQVLVNLAVNARDAMPDGGTLVIETSNIDLDEGYCARHAQVHPGKFVLLSVSDTGHGMSDEVKKHVFEPFFTTKSMGRGTGLGLATIFGIVQQAGGAIEVYSEEGRGTAFKIYLPRIEEKAEKYVKKSPEGDPPTGSETLLLVEDEEGVRIPAVKALERLGYRVLSAPTGKEAFACAETYRDRIDLLMTDVVMPGINGRELAERLRALHPEMRVLFTSGYTQNVIVHHGVVEENLNFIGKPYSLRALATKIREVLEPKD
jgi:two-component system cell cycle sensor histidine kinase/response regulator CckA